MLHYIDSDWSLQTRLAFAKGLGELAHTGDNIKALTYKGLLSVGIGSSLEDVKNNIHMSTSDEGSNMKKGWAELEGSGCVCHREQNSLGSAVSLDCIKPLLKNIKGICAHFHRSDKVSFNY